MTQLVEQCLLVGPEAFGRSSLMRRTPGLLDALGEERQIVLGRLELRL
jgi:hypothetical protein